MAAYDFVMDVIGRSGMFFISEFLFYTLIHGNPEYYFGVFLLINPGKEKLLKDWDYMGLAIKLARRGCGFVNPNPMVGAVIVKDGEIIGEGYHEYYGGPHGERNALANCTISPRGGTLYVTLEPCCHHGKTPPCTDAIIESGIKRVVIGMKDPNPKVSGKGIAILRENGIMVDMGVKEKECMELNRVFIHAMVKKMPYVAIKYGMTLDGKIATVTGDSKWITGEKAREHVHFLRHKYTGIMVGIGTVLADDPMLNCRSVEGRNPIRIVCDTNLRIPLESKIVSSSDEIITYIAYGRGEDYKVEELKKRGCRLIEVEQKGSHLDLPALMRYLFQEGIDGVLCEGGGYLNFSLLEEGLVNKIYSYVSPKIIGGEKAKTPVMGAGLESLNDAVLFEKPIVTSLGEDILLECLVKA